MAELEKLVTKLEGDLSGLQATLTKADALTRKHMGAMQRSANSLNKQVSGVIGPFNALKGAVAALGAGAMVAAARSALNYADSIKELSVQSGFGTDTLQELRFAAVQSGLSTEQLDKALLKLTVTMGAALTQGGEAAAEYKRLGVALVDTAGNVRGSEEVFNDIIAALGKVGSEAERNAIQVKIFGKEAGPKFAELVGSGTAALDELRRAAHEAGAVLDKDLIDNASKNADKLDALALVIKTQMTQALVDLGPALVTASGFMSGFAKTVREAGEGLGIFFAAMSAGSDIPFEDQINDQRAAVGKLAADLKRAEDQAARAPTGGLLGRLLADSPEELAAARKALDEASKRLDDLKRKQLDFLTMGNTGPAKSPAKTGGKAGESDEARAAREALAKKAEAMAKRQEAELNALKDSLGAQVETIAESLFTEEEAIAASYARRISIISESLARGVIDQEEANAHLAGLERQRAAESEALLFEQIGMSQHAAKAMADFEILTAQNKAVALKTIGQDLLGAFSQTSQKAFKLSKALATADAIVNTYRAAAKAIGESSNIYEGIAKAAVALAFGFAQVRAIRATQFGGAGGGVAAGSPSASVGGVGGGGFSNEQRGPSRTIQIQGLNPNDLFTGRQLMDLINQATQDGGRLIT